MEKLYPCLVNNNDTNIAKMRSTLNKEYNTNDSNDLTSIEVEILQKNQPQQQQPEQQLH